MTDPEHGFVHEWLHQVEAVYRRPRASVRTTCRASTTWRTAGPRGPTPRTGPETYVEFERRTGSWRPWYRDLMTGTVGPKAGEAPRVRGLTRERWLRRPNP